LDSKTVIGALRTKKTLR